MHKGLSVYSVNGLDTSHKHGHAGELIFLKALEYLSLDRCDKGVTLIAANFHLLFDLGVGVGVKVAEG